MSIYCPVSVHIGEELDRYNFGPDHPFGPGRMHAFWNEALKRGSDRDVEIFSPVMASDEIIEEFHDEEYVDHVRLQSEVGEGFLDGGDTPACRGIYEASLYVAGTVLDSLSRIMQGEIRRGFVPIAGLHHARRNASSGFSVFNDCALVIDTLLKGYRMDSVLYVDIDAHHGDGVYYSFESDPRVFIVDIHEDGHFLYPGTGDASEIGQGDATGTKLNFPLPPGADDKDFRIAWEIAESFIEKVKPEFIVFQCGADGMAGDPMAHLKYSANSYGYVTRRLCRIAEDYCEGRILALGGGGYEPVNIAKAWNAVLEGLIESPFGRTTSLLA